MSGRNVPALTWPLRVSCHRRSIQSKEISQVNGAPLPNSQTRRTDKVTGIGLCLAFIVRSLVLLSFFRWASTKFENQPRHSVVLEQINKYRKQKTNLSRETVALMFPKEGTSSGISISTSTTEELRYHIERTMRRRERRRRKPFWLCMLV